MEMTSPPAFGVDQARRGPYLVLLFHNAVVELARAEDRCASRLGVRRTPESVWPCGDAAGDFAADRPQLALEIADAGFAGVFADDRAGWRRPSRVSI